MYCYDYFKCIINYTLLRTRQETMGFSRTNLCFARPAAGTGVSPVPSGEGSAEMLARPGCARSQGLRLSESSSRLSLGRHSPTSSQHSRRLPSTVPPASPRSERPARPGVGSGHPPPVGLRTPEAPHRRPRAGSAHADGALRMLNEPRARRLRRGRRDSAGRRPSPEPC